MLATSSAGSNAFIFFALLAIALLVLLVLRYYLPLRSTPAYLLLPIYLALALPASIILLVPIDLASHASDTHEATRGVWLADGALLVMWRITYWLAFALTWCVVCNHRRACSNSNAGSSSLFSATTRMPAIGNPRSASSTRYAPTYAISLLYFFRGLPGWYTFSFSRVCE